MTRTPVAAFAAALLLLAGCSREPILEGPYRVPPGFVVERLLPAGQDETLIQVTFDSLGRPVVSRENGNPTILFDNDGDGIFESEKIFSDKVEMAHGMWFDGRTLYATGRDPENKQAGLYKMEDLDGDEIADTFEKLHDYTGPIGEHGPHDIRRAPDGQPSVMMGNHTSVPAELIDPGSPLRDARESQLLERYMDARGHAVGIMAPGGTMSRLRLDPLRYSRIAGGFRNAFNHAYNREGELFTFDSDMEWDVNMPWYREVRSLHVIPGGDYGWRTGSGKFPPYYIDSLPPLRELGRGSPVGVEFYHHYAYPPEYFDAFLQADWSRGRIVMLRMVRDGATYKWADEPMDFVYGEPLNVTDLEVGPDGMVYFTMGGRNTAGGLYRVAYKGSRSNDSFLKTKGIWAAIRQPQPLSSWGWAAIEKVKEEMGERWSEELHRVALSTSARASDRVQALMLIQQHGRAARADLLRTLSHDPHPHVRAAAIYDVGQHGSDRAKAIAASGLKDTDPFVRRRAAEAVVRMGLSPDQPSFAPIDDLYAMLTDRDRWVRYAGRAALERTPRQEWSRRVIEEANPQAAAVGLVALIRTAQSAADIEPAIPRALALLGREGLPADTELDLLRAFHLACTELENGCPQEARSEASRIASTRFPARDERLNREYARTMAYADDSAAIAQILDAMPKGDEKQQLQIHYAYCLREIKAGWTSAQKRTLLSWFSKARQWRGGASFPGFINRLFDSSLDFFDEHEKQMAYQAIPDFAPIEDLDAAGLRRGRDGYVPARVFARQSGSSALSAEEVFEHTLFNPATGRAQPERGKEIYEKECSRCHRFGDLGEDYGPDLTTLANRFQRRDTLEAILWPSRTVSDQYQSSIIETTGNDIIDGLILSEDNERVTMMIPDQERPVAISKDQIRGRRVSSVSAMPEGLLDPYDLNRIADLLAFLQQSTAAAAGQ
ncbi:MAG: HEAT repeat domain-containing protein [Acidobacteria bacterium]|nr:HEAT repeat domain-containing protein [Acidobacteriota bacterium]